MNIIAIATIPLMTAVLLFFYEQMVKGGTSVFVNSALNIIAYACAAACSLIFEKPSWGALKIMDKLPLIITYIVVDTAVILLWYRMTRLTNAPYVSIFEGTAVLFLIILNLVFVKGYAIDSKFIIGTVIVITGIVIIQWS